MSQHGGKAKNAKEHNKIQLLEIKFITIYAKQGLNHELLIISLMLPLDLHSLGKLHNWSVNSLN